MLSIPGLGLKLTLPSGHRARVVDNRLAFEATRGHRK